MDKIRATFDKDTKNFHRYLIDNGQLINGSLYISKEIPAVPDELVIKLGVKVKLDGMHHFDGSVTYSAEKA